MLSLTELGNRLKEAREQKNLSLDDVQTLTKIQKRYLIGIEEGNYALMPGKFYIRAFIKQYAEAVGLDPEMIFEEYKEEIPATYNDDLPEQLSRVQSRKSISTKSDKIVGILPKILVTALIFIIAVGIWVFAQKNSDKMDKTSDNPTEDIANVEVPPDSPLDDENASDTDTVDEDTKTEVETETDESDDQDQEEVDPEPTQKIEVVEKNDGNSTLQLTNTDQFNLEIGSTGKTWVQISNGNGKTFFSGTLTTDTPVEKHDFTNETEVLLNIGRAPDTVIKINGQEVPFPIDPKEKDVQKIKILFQKQ